MFNTYSKEESVQNISEYGISNRTGIQPFSPSLNQPSLSFVPIYLAIHLKVSLGYPMQWALLIGWKLTNGWAWRGQDGMTDYTETGLQANERNLTF